MRLVSADVVLLCTSCFLGLVYVPGVCAMELDFRGSPKEVQGELYSVFPIGTHKSEVVSTAESEFGMDRFEFQTSEFGVEPLEYMLDGEKLLAHSWIGMHLAQYRSIKWLFVKVDVMAGYFFDSEGKLIGIEVRLYLDSL